MIRIAIAESRHMPEIRYLLENAKLPLQDHNKYGNLILVARKDGQILGSVALERYGGDGLLRSLVVAPLARQQGIGRDLCLSLFEYAANLHLGKIFLLTETAAPFFSRLGFQPVIRDVVPKPVRTSSEFKFLCPLSAAAMELDLLKCPLVGEKREDCASVRPATDEDMRSLALIYNSAVEERVANFETEGCIPSEIKAWFDGKHPIVCVEEKGEVVAFACASQYRSKACYAGVAELCVFVRKDVRGNGYGKKATEALVRSAQRAGYWKLLSQIFVENAAGRALASGLGFREVGIFEKHGTLDGKFRDLVIVEKLLEPPAL